MSVLNSTILEQVWMSGSNDYQQRIPRPLQNQYHQHVSAIFDPYNADLFNAFTGLLNGIVGTYIEGKTFYNPLREIKKPAPAGMESFGAVERHIAVQYIQSHSYKADDETLLKYEPPTFREWYYSTTEPRMYPFTWSRFDLMRAFAQDGTGFADLLDATISQAISSDEYDEMNIMLQMLAEGDISLENGIYRNTLSAAPTNQATGQELLAKLRADAGRMKFPNTIYNHLDIPVFESADRLILLVTPETLAVLDVFALSQVFQLDKADIQYRIIEVPELPIANAYAALMSEDFIWCRDAYYSVEPPFYNPAQLSYKYYLAHAEFVGVNPAANCCLYVTA